METQALKCIIHLVGITLFKRHKMSSFSPLFLLCKGIESCFSASLGARVWVVMAWSAICCQERRVWGEGSLGLTCFASDAAGGACPEGSTSKKSSVASLVLWCKTSPFLGFFKLQVIQTEILGRVRRSCEMFQRFITTELSLPCYL